MGPAWTGNIVGVGILTTVITAGVARAEGPSLWDTIHEANVIVLARATAAGPFVANGPVSAPAHTSDTASGEDAVVETVQVLNDVGEPSGDDGDASGEVNTSEVDTAEVDTTDGYTTDGDTTEEGSRPVFFTPPPMTRTDFAVMETWKGPEVSSLQAYSYGQGLASMCPIGRTVVAMFKQMEGRLWPIVCLYGDANADPTPEELESVRKQIRRAVALQARRPSGRDRVDWLVSQIAIPSMRRSALYELFPSADRVSFFREPVMRLPLAPLLAPSQMDRIASVFTKQPEADETLPLFLAVLADHPSSRVDETAVALIDAELAQGGSGWALADAIGLTLDRYGDPDRQERVAQWMSPYGMPNGEELKKLWESARHDLGIPSGH